MGSFSALAIHDNVLTAVVKQMIKANGPLVICLVWRGHGLQPGLHTPSRYLNHKGSRASGFQRSY